MIPPKNGTFMSALGSALRAWMSKWSERLGSPTMDDPWMMTFPCWIEGDPQLKAQEPKNSIYM